MLTGPLLDTRSNLHMLMLGVAATSLFVMQNIYNKQVLTKVSRNTKQDKLMSFLTTNMEHVEIDRYMQTQ